MLDHIPNREALGAADNLEAFTPDRMAEGGFRRLTAEDTQAIREGVALDRLARALGEAITTKRPDVRLDGLVAVYPFGEAPLDLRKLAANWLAQGTYHV